MEKHTAGYMSRVETPDRINYLHTPSRFGGPARSSLELKEDGPAAAVTVFNDTPATVQLCLRYGSFDATVHITASQARAIASALFEAATDAERLQREAHLADFEDSTWPAMAATQED